MSFVYVQLVKKKADMQQMIQNRMKKIQEIQHSAEQRKVSGKNVKLTMHYNTLLKKIMGTLKAHI